MQETHLKKGLKTNILATLRAFNAGESEIIPFSESQTDTNTFRSRYSVLRRNGNVQGKYMFVATSEPAGTLICRVK